MAYYYTKYGGRIWQLRKNLTLPSDGSRQVARFRPESASTRFVLFVAVSEVGCLGWYWFCNQKFLRTNHQTTRRELCEEYNSFWYCNWSRLPTLSGHAKAFCSATIRDLSSVCMTASRSWQPSISSTFQIHPSTLLANNNSTFWCSGEEMRCA